MSDAYSDEFSAFEFPEFTDEEFAQIDAAISQSLNSPPVLGALSDSLGASFELDSNFIDLRTLSDEDFSNIDSQLEGRHDFNTLQTNTGPKIPIEIESPANNLGYQSQTSTSKNIPIASMQCLIQQFRSKRILSVTDLTSPTWCEVQFEYGLLGKRSRPIAQRPKSFVTPSGKEIRVERTTALQNDKTTKKGMAIHKKLEREIHPEEVKVEVTTEEERWALRLINMMYCLKEVSLEGFTREMPVFGLIEGEVVVGIVDEVSRIPNGPVPTNGTDNPIYSFRVVDTKTRRTDSLPPQEDTLPARLQVMLYHRLLSTLISRSQPFNFPFFWKKLGLNTSKPFSTSFITQAGLLSEGTCLGSTCLDDLSNSWSKFVMDIGISTVHPELQLVYRLQSPGTNKKGKRSQRPFDKVQPQQNEVSSLQSDEELMIQWAILQSLLPVNSSDTANQSASSSNAHLAPRGIHPPVPDDSGHSKVIGTKEVIQDDEFLNMHISKVLKLWRGERKPEGVPLSLSRRCQTCEYKNDCEWREQKAEKFLKNLEKNRDRDV